MNINSIEDLAKQLQIFREDIKNMNKKQIDETFHKLIISAYGLSETLDLKNM